MKWSYKITLLYLGFVALILTLVIGSTKQKVHMVTESYYQEEIAHDAMMERIQNTRKLTIAPSITYAHDAQELQLFIPNSDNLEGEILLYRPNDSEADQEIPLTPTGEKPQSIDVASLARGLWRIQVTWETADTPYYWEKAIVL
ncbi:MAG: FixH family protein [Bacteroidota bacterium]